MTACAVQMYLSDNAASWAKVASGTFADTGTLKTFALPTATAAMGFRIVATTEAGAFRAFLIILHAVGAPRHVCNTARPDSCPEYLPALLQLLPLASRQPCSLQTPLCTRRRL